MKVPKLDASKHEKQDGKGWSLKLCSEYSFNETFDDNFFVGDNFDDNSYIDDNSFIDDNLYIFVITVSNSRNFKTFIQVETKCFMERTGWRGATREILG